MSAQEKTIAVILTAPVELFNSQGNVFITLFQKKDFLVAKWHGHITSEDVIIAATAYEQLISQHSCAKLLNDKSDITGEWDDANDFLEFDWIPAVIDAGLLCMAHVYSQNMLSCSSEYELFLRAAPQLQVANFTELALAEQWLANCEVAV
ncbi:hypothetical protein [Pontibacter rugosus]|uniref:STAS/SEC14 domain-containing protein n=1 Tax=Pontibacter rugosus TaxID=1745966 RepID=A0ABW3SUJ1_9BACT